MGWNYAAKLQDPRWRARRLEILERDDWECLICGADEHLQVNHRWYKGDPWEVPDEALTTLCAACHKKETEGWRAIGPKLEWAARRHLFAHDGAVLLKGLAEMEETHLPEVVVEVLAWVMRDRDAQRRLVEDYFERVVRPRAAKGPRP